ncbi:hypothetical protein AOLI_G00022370 [Acnodon oligacanthus]
MGVDDCLPPSSTTRRELLAVVEFTRHFHQYLLGRPFIVRSDYSSLRWLVKMKEPEGQLARWLEKLAEYDFKVVHQPGHHHHNADVMSRRPCPPTCPCNMTDPAEGNGKVHHQGVQCNLELLGDATSMELGVVGVGAHPSERTRLFEVVPKADQECQTSVERVYVSDTTPTVLFNGWTMEDLCTAQKADPDIAPVWRWLEEGGERPTWVDVSPLGWATKASWSQWKRLYMQEGILLRRFYSTNEAVFHPQIALPCPLRQDVLKQMHDGPMGGHFGVERTLACIQTRYYWYQMRFDVTLWCYTCTHCAAKACPSKKPQAPMGTVRMVAPMERIAIDLMEPMNETERHNRYILVAQDYFTKWVEAYPLPNDHAVTVAEALTAEWVCRYGVPQTLHSDQGSNFESDVFRRMCKLLGIEKTHTTPFRPQSDGQVERFNATLQKILATTAERCHWDWDLMTPLAVMAYRTTEHSSTGLTPNMMLFGRELTEPTDLVAGLPPDHDSAKTPPEYIAQLRDRLELAQRIARETLGESVKRAKKQYDKNAHKSSYNIGQSDDLVYRIQKNPKTKVKVVHHDKLKPYHSRSPLDTSWVHQYAKACHPVQVVPPALEDDTVTSDLDLPSLFSDKPSCDNTDYVIDSPSSALSSPEGPDELQFGSGSTVQQGQTWAVSNPAVDPTSKRPKRDIKPPKRFGDWIVSLTELKPAF